MALESMKKAYLYWMDIPNLYIGTELTTYYGMAGRERNAYALFPVAIFL